ncbi:MAG: hypothetical protein BAA01_04780 [Bacillus thermozeamaize]|uniref:Uncharacterized protein n=1 Tax=Bacillus thermozeamaize TaxID=230954 RepID=A0A1Y3PJQ1_9BACI|nr:MAG: hypothetical protein BAA01_04780 [Bacillus thermozeamaize]
MAEWVRRHHHDARSCGGLFFLYILPQRLRPFFLSHARSIYSFIKTEHRCPLTTIKWFPLPAEMKTTGRNENQKNFSAEFHVQHHNHRYG